MGHRDERLVSIDEMMSGASPEPMASVTSLPVQPETIPVGSRGYPVVMEDGRAKINFPARRIRKPVDMDHLYRPEPETGSRYSVRIEGDDDYLVVSAQGPRHQLEKLGIFSGKGTDPSQENQVEQFANNIDTKLKKEPRITFESFRNSKLTKVSAFVLFSLIVLPELTYRGLQGEGSYVTNPGDALNNVKKGIKIAGYIIPGI